MAHSTTHYARLPREDASHSGRLSGMSRPSHAPPSSLRDDLRRSKTPAAGYPSVPPQPRQDRNFLVPRSEAPRTTADPQSRIREIEYAMLMAAQLKEQQQWQRQHTPSHSRQSSQSGYYHPTTTQQTPFQLPHMVNAPINRPSTAPPQQLRSVLAPPQSPERYRTPRPRSPVGDFPGEFFCKRCNMALADKTRFLEHMNYTHGNARIPRH